MLEDHLVFLKRRVTLFRGEPLSRMSYSTQNGVTLLEIELIQIFPFEDDIHLRMNISFLEALDLLETALSGRELDLISSRKTQSTTVASTTTATAMEKLNNHLCTKKKKKSDRQKMGYM